MDEWVRSLVLGGRGDFGAAFGQYAGHFGEVLAVCWSPDGAQGQVGSRCCMPLTSHMHHNSNLQYHLAASLSIVHLILNSQCCSYSCNRGSIHAFWDEFEAP